MSLDDYFDPRVRGTVRLESGRAIEVSARPRKGVGFSDHTMVMVRPLGARLRSSFGVRADLLRGFGRQAGTSLGLSSPDPSVEDAVHLEPTIGFQTSALTMRDAQVIADWLDSEQKQWER